MLETDYSEVEIDDIFLMFGGSDKFVVNHYCFYRNTNSKAKNQKWPPLSRQIIRAQISRNLFRMLTNIEVWFDFRSAISWIGTDSQFSTTRPSKR